MSVKRVVLGDELSAPAWFDVREAQVRGVDLADHAAPMRAVVAQRAPSAPQGPLKGRPGVAAIVAGALNAVAAGPNTLGRVDLPWIKGVLTRGAGRDLSARGRVLGSDVGAKGTLDPPTGRAEIGLSGVAGDGIGLPPRVRVYTTPTGELDIDLSGPIKLGPFSRPKGTYVIGVPDARKKR